MALKLLTDEQLRKLTPEERIKYLRSLEAQQKSDAEEAARKAREEIEAAEALIRESEEELEEEEAQEGKEAHDKSEKRQKEEASLRKKEESIDDLVAQARAGGPSGQYRTDKPYEAPAATDSRSREENPLYTTLERAAQDLRELYGKDDWSGEDERHYRDAKAQIERASTYQLSGDRLAAELGLARDELNRMQYRH